MVDIGGSGVSEAHRCWSRLHYIATTRPALSEKQWKAELELWALGKEFAR